MSYRTHRCGVFRASHVGQAVKIAGWVHRKRDHGHLLFIDLRDDTGLVQCVADDASLTALLHEVSLESVVQFEGTVTERTAETLNADMATGAVEIRVSKFVVLSRANPLPFPVNQDGPLPEELRLKNRFLDLRRSVVHERMVLRSQIISFLRAQMVRAGFLEMQTPILGPITPEGARDFLVPSRNHPGRFYALPQAPQLFKQLFMASGFDRYFQVAPCFRDEDARADRSPGEFYQLDFEMAFATQDLVFETLEPVLRGVFSEFGRGRTVTEGPFPRIPYAEALNRYGSDKPDLRNPLLIEDWSALLQETGPFSETLAAGGRVKVIPVSDVADQPRRFFEDLGDWAKTQGLEGLGYVLKREDGWRGPLVKFFNEAVLAQLETHACGTGLFFVCAEPEQAWKVAGRLRQKLGETLGRIDKNRFALCWITDFPMYERDENTGQIVFSHNPFSMPQGGMEALLTQDPLLIKAYQYDVVCNGIELSSGAVRNHLPELMLKAFEIGGYTRESVERMFRPLLEAFRFGVPPHAGSAPGIDRIVMLLADVENIREIIPYPLTQNGMDLLMGSPVPIDAARLKELHLSLVQSSAKVKVS